MTCQEQSPTSLWKHRLPTLSQVPSRHSSPEQDVKDLAEGHCPEGAASVEILNPESGPSVWRNRNDRPAQATGSRFVTLPVYLCSVFEAFGCIGTLHLPRENITGSFDSTENLLRNTIYSAETARTDDTPAHETFRIATGTPIDGARLACSANQACCCCTWEVNWSNWPLRLASFASVFTAASMWICGTVASVWEDECNMLVVWRRSARR